MFLGRFSLIACTLCALWNTPITAAEKVDSCPNCSCNCSPNMMSKAFTSVAKKAIPAVVFIKAEGNTSDQEDYGLPPNFQNPFDPFSGDDLFNRFFGFPYQNRPQKPQPQMSQGSGFLVSPDGYIMTNNHVVRNAEKITVVLHDGKEMDATVVGSDTHTDVAIIKIEGKNFPYLNLGDSDALEIGEWVVAIGSPFQLQASLTVGVVSAKGRQDLQITDLEDFIQTDAAINPGNSGGPLLNLNSDVIGINTAIVSRTGGYMGIGFAIPSQMAKGIMKQIMDNGVVTRGFMGVSLQPLDKEMAAAFNLEKPEGALVSEVVKDSPADKAGIKQGDIILECNGIPIKSLGSFRNEISLMAPGATVALTINRNGELIKRKVVLGSASDTASASITQKLGLEVQDLTPDISRQLGLNATDTGVVVTKIRPGSPSAQVGIHPGFLIIAVNHKKISNVSEFNEALKESTNKNRVLILARKGNISRFYSLKLE